MGHDREVDARSILVSAALVAVGLAVQCSTAQAQVTSATTRVATLRAATVAQSASIIGTIRKVAKCAVGIVGFVAANSVAVAKLRKAGGVWKVAKATFKAKGRLGKLKVLSAVFGELSGLNAVAEGCGI